jgi:integrase
MGADRRQGRRLHQGDRRTRPRDRARRHRERRPRWDLVRREAKWIETHDAAVLLLAARALPVRGGTSLNAEAIARIRSTWAEGKTTKLALARAHGVSNVWIARLLDGREATPPIADAVLACPLLATYLLTGGRESEVTGLELDDVSLDRRTITFRPNAWRRLKTPGSHRVVRLWPQLAEILGAYMAWRLVQRGGRLLFPSPWSAEERTLVDVRKLLDRVAVRAGLGRGELRTKAFRHTYCAARLQTLDQGAPVSTYTVARELGHESEAMVRRVYAHLGEIRHRSEVVEFRVGQHLERLGDRLQAAGGPRTSQPGGPIAGRGLRSLQVFPFTAPWRCIDDARGQSNYKLGRDDFPGRPASRHFKSQASEHGCEY